MLKGETDDYFEVGGIASTDDRDLQNEIIEQAGLDLSGLRQKRIVFNDDHSKETKDILGIVDTATVTDEGLVVKGKIFKNNPAGVTYYNLLKHGGYVGFSVEGAVMQRDQMDKSRIKKAKLTAIALTRNPVNTKTYANFCKSLTAENEVLEETEMTLESKVDFLLEMVTDLVKGGPGSGRKGGGGGAPAAQAGNSSSGGSAISDDKVQQMKDAQDDASIINDGSSKDDDGPKHDRKDKSEEKRQQMKAEIMAAKGKFKGPELKGAIAIIKRKFFGNKVRVAKSLVMAEAIKRAKADPEFAKALQLKLQKALTSGGPAYSDTLIGDMTNGQCFQMEGHAGAVEPKKKKKKDETSDK